jgi:hypothetical protein
MAEDMDLSTYDGLELPSNATIALLTTAQEHETELDEMLVRFGAHRDPAKIRGGKKTNRALRRMQKKRNLLITRVVAIRLHRQQTNPDIPNFPPAPAPAPAPAAIPAALVPGPFHQPTGILALNQTEFVGARALSRAVFDVGLQPKKGEFTGTKEFITDIERGRAIAEIRPSSPYLKAQPSPSRPMQTGPSRRSTSTWWPRSSSTGSPLAAASPPTIIAALQS